MRVLHTSAHTSVLSALHPPTKHTASTRVHALTRFNYSRPFSPQRTVVLHNVCVLLGCETQLKWWWNPLHPFSSEDLEPSGCSRFRFIILMSELSLLILHFLPFWPSDQSLWGKPWFFLLLRIWKCKPGAEMKRFLSRFICCWQLFRRMCGNRPGCFYLVWRTSRALQRKRQNKNNPQSSAVENGHLLLLPWNHRPCLHSHPPRLAVEKNKNHPLDLADSAQL